MRPSHSPKVTHLIKPFISKDIKPNFFFHKHLQLGVYKASLLLVNKIIRCVQSEGEALLR